MNAKPKMATSYNHGAPFRSQTYPQYSPQPPQEQFGSFNPGGHIPQYGGSPDPGYKPFQSNPYLYSAFTGMPQQLVYNITHIHNDTMPQQPQLPLPEKKPTSTLQKYNGLFTLLGGALKLAGTVLGPTLEHDWSSLTA
jgi:hypothetical protein